MFCENDHGQHQWCNRLHEMGGIVTQDENMSKHDAHEFQLDQIGITRRSLSKLFILFITSDTSAMLAVMTPQSKQVVLLFACVLLVLTTASFSFAQDSSRPAGTIPIPDAMRRFLDRNPVYHVLTLDDVSKFWRVEFEGGQNKHKLQSIAVGDANRDGVADVCAVLVSTSRKYGVACFQGRDEPVWVRKDESEEILGVAVNTGMVTPFFCYSCDANHPFRWSGSAYELGIRLPGEGACINPGSVVLVRPETEAPVVFTASNGFGYVKVLSLGPKAKKNTRWHNVLLLDRDGKPLIPSITGWLDSSSFFSDIGC
jgi:hypothetical protein